MIRHRGSAAISDRNVGPGNIDEDADESGNKRGLRRKLLGGSFSPRSRSELSRSRTIYLVICGISIAVVFLMTREPVVDQFSTSGQGGVNGSIQKAKQSTRVHEKTLNPDLDNNGCRYDGHCPLRSTCSASNDGGFCEPIISQGSQPGKKASDECYESCLDELKWDEHFTQESWPEVDWSETIKSQGGRPDGCLLVFHRSPQADKWKDVDDTDAKEDWIHKPPFIPHSFETWMNEKRFRHIKRVDPLNDDMADNKFIAYCTQPCNSDADCATKHDAFTCVKGACQRNPKYWGNDNNADMVLVTAANSGYFGGLTNFAASARYWAPMHKLVVYNLGLTNEQMDQVEKWSNVIALEWRDGIPKKYPDHVRAPKQYAWKPVIQNETLYKYKSVFVLDAGSTLTGPIKPVIEILQRDGILLVKGQDGDMRLSHEGTYKWHGLDKATLKTGPHYSGNTQGYLLGSRYMHNVHGCNVKCAMDPNCISPPGHSLGNHRYDQTSLSICAYKLKDRGTSCLLC